MNTSKKNRKPTLSGLTLKLSAWLHDEKIIILYCVHFVSIVGESLLTDPNVFPVQVGVRHRNQGLVVVHGADDHGNLLVLKLERPRISVCGLR